MLSSPIGSGKVVIPAVTTPSREPEADQRALLKVLVDKRLEGEAGPLYNQLQIRYSVRMIEGLFYTPALRTETLMTRDAIESIHRAFGMSKI